MRFTDILNAQSFVGSQLHSGIYSKIQEAKIPENFIKMIPSLVFNTRLIEYRRHGKYRILADLRLVNQSFQKVHFSR